MAIRYLPMAILSIRQFALLLGETVAGEMFGLNKLYSGNEKVKYYIIRKFPNNYRIMKLTRSFRHAWHGIRYCYRTQLNFRIHVVVLLLVIITGFILKISKTEWLFVVLCSMLVLTLEILNTTIEYMCDTVTKDIHPAIKIIKDTSAAAVLLGAAGSAVTGSIIFLPKILVLFKI